jgi:hypothetical protein
VFDGFSDGISTGTTALIFTAFSQSFQEKFRDSGAAMAPQFPSKYFPIQYSTGILPFHSVLPVTPTES